MLVYFDKKAKTYLSAAYHAYHLTEAQYQWFWSTSVHLCSLISRFTLFLYQQVGLRFKTFFLVSIKRRIKNYNNLIPSNGHYLRRRKRAKPSVLYGVASYPVIWSPQGPLSLDMIGWWASPFRFVPVKLFNKFIHSCTELESFETRAKRALKSDKIPSNKLALRFLIAIERSKFKPYIIISQKLIERQLILLVEVCAEVRNGTDYYEMGTNHRSGMSHRSGTNYLFSYG